MRRASRWRFCRPDAAKTRGDVRAPAAAAARAASKVAPAVERPGIHLGVWRDRGEFPSGAPPAKCRRSASWSKSSTSGLLVVKHRPEPFGKFVNVAVLEAIRSRSSTSGVDACPIARRC